MVFTVSELNRHIKTTLEPLYTDIWVEGEVSNVHIPTSGHCYFTLKDNAASIRAVLFRMQRAVVRFTPEDGLTVLCRGSIGVYEPRGEYQIIVQALEPKGLGALQLSVRQLHQKLAREGLFDRERKKPIPFLPRAIAVVSSPTGAVVHDIIRIVHRRFPSVKIIIVPVQVQGTEAAADIERALMTVNRLRCADVIILARGGGSLEDLQAFNTEQVARAIAASAVPVISAIGHETDVTIADYAADVRAPTPSAAAEMAVREQHELARTIAVLQARLQSAAGRHIGAGRERNRHQCALLQRWPHRLADMLLLQDDLQARLMRGVRAVVAGERIRLNAARRILASRTPRIRSAAARAALTGSVHRLRTSLRTALQAQTVRLAAALARLDSLNPAAVLKRGFSITRALPSHALITDAAAVRPGDAVRVTLSRGGIDCLVQKVVQ